MAHLQLLKSELYSALIMATIVAALVSITAPVPPDDDRAKWRMLFRAWAVAFVVMYAIYYFSNNSGSEDIMQNILKTDPDF